MMIGCAHAERWPALPALVILSAHALLVVLPVALGWWLIGPARPWLDEASSAIAMMATAALLLEFLLSGRFRVISAGIKFSRKSSR